MRRRLAGLAFVGTLVVAGLEAQYPPLVLPRASQRASVSQTIGLTEISISYHRPAVGGREVWGKLVPFDTRVAGRREREHGDRLLLAREGGGSGRAGRTVRPPHDPVARASGPSS